MNANTTTVHGVGVSTVLLESAGGFINGLAAVTQDALELSSSDVFLLGLVYEAQSGRGRSRQTKKKKAATTTHLLSSNSSSSSSNHHKQRRPRSGHHPLRRGLAGWRRSPAPAAPADRL